MYADDTRPYYSFNVKDYVAANDKINNYLRNIHDISKKHSYIQYYWYAKICEKLAIRRISKTYKQNMENAVSFVCIYLAKINRKRRWQIRKITAVSRKR